VICPFVATAPVLCSVAVSLDCVRVHSLWLICLCVPTQLSRPQPDLGLWLTKGALGRVLESRDMTHKVGRRAFIAVAWVLFQTYPCAICGGQNYTGTRFSPNT
jgi:hypothetical protein